MRRPVEINLSAALVAMRRTDSAMPLILTTIDHSGGHEKPGLPYGPFNPLAHRTMETGLRAWVTEQAKLPLAYVEQLYTFGDRGRNATLTDTGPHIVSIGYLALARTPEPSADGQAEWRNWYDFLPWEDWRKGRPAMIDTIIAPALKAYRDAVPQSAVARRDMLSQRIRLAFGNFDGQPFDDERVLDRYELLYEADLLPEVISDGRAENLREALIGTSMMHDHRRILATAISRLRGKLKYRPVIFELMPPTFTLTELQETAEAISGRLLHKQNFRRLVIHADLVEETGEMRIQQRGRPAALFRFRRAAADERPSAGLRLGIGRS